MLVVARDRVNGHKTLFGSGTNQFGSLLFENLSIKVKIPKKITYFRDSEPTRIPVKLATSRYQSYVLTMENEKFKEKSIGECKFCNAFIKDIAFIRPKEMQETNENENLNKMVVNEVEYYEYFCENCVTTKVGSEMVYAINIPTKYLQPGMLQCSKDLMSVFLNMDQNSQISDGIINSNSNETIVTTSNSQSQMNIIFLDKDNFIHDETNQHFSYNCVDCFIPIANKVFVSTEDNSLILCSRCFANCSAKVEYPQVFYVMNKLRLDSSLKGKFPKLDLAKVLWNIEKTEKPYFSIKITPKPSQTESLLMLSKEKALFQQFAKWKKLSDSHLIELNKLKDEIEGFIKDGTLNETYLTTLTHNPTAAYLDYMRSTESDKFSLLKTLDQDELNLLNELSSSINESIFYLMNLTYNIKEKGFLHNAITENLGLVSSKARLDIFHERLDKLKVSVNPGEKEMPISRMKAIKFYEKKTIDTTGEYTIFGQLFHKMKKYPLANYLCKKDGRLFQVNLSGEGATDYGGPYREVLSTACEELHSMHLDLFVKSPNNRNEIGAMRDKYVPNPGAKSAMHVDMYFFLGCLIGSAISTGQLVNLNIHPVIWSMILNHSVNFAVYETIDKLFYKSICEIEKFKGSQSDFEYTFVDQYFLVILSDGSEQELMPQGRKTPVTLENKDKFVSLAKTARLNEFKHQVDSIRYGLINVIPDNVLSILTGKEVESLSCGEPTLNIEILKKYTEYQNYSATDETIKYFWTALESFTNEEKVSYLKYVWGRTRLPDAKIFPFIHVITRMSHSSPDTRLPSATTCYFTLKLPMYSTQEVMTNKLRYVINNCAEIDADFNVSSTPDME